MQGKPSLLSDMFSESTSSMTSGLSSMRNQLSRYLLHYLHLKALQLRDTLCSTAGWRSAGKPRFEVRNLQRTLKKSTVPIPKTLLRMILNATLPRLIQRALLVALPPELGQYLLACKQGVHIAGAVLHTSAWRFGYVLAHSE